MLRILCFATALAAASVVAPLPAAAAPGPATQEVKQANEKMSRLLRKQVKAGSAEEKRQAAAVTAELRDFLDIDELGRLALEAHWKDLSQKQQGEYLELLRSLIEANYIKGLRAKLDYKVRYTGEKKRGDKRVVATEVVTTHRGRPTTVDIDYLVRREDGGWRAVDVITDGVGLVENYRAQFNRIIAKEGVDGLLSRMRKKLAMMKK